MLNMVTLLQLKSLSRRNAVCRHIKHKETGFIYISFVTIKCFSSLVTVVGESFIFLLIYLMKYLVIKRQEQNVSSVVSINPRFMSEKISKNSSFLVK